MLLPGAHSCNDGADGEQVPEWVLCFQKFWEHKKHHPSKSAQEEQQREERRTMQRTILHPVQPLGRATDVTINETTSLRSRQQSSNSLIVVGGTMSVDPTANSTATTPRSVNARRVSTGSQRRRNSEQQPIALNASYPEVSHFMEAMNASNRSLFCRSYKEIGGL
jgi:hypothetical protein